MPRESLRRARELLDRIEIRDRTGQVLRDPAIRFALVLRELEGDLPEEAGIEIDWSRCEVDRLLLARVLVSLPDEAISAMFRGAPAAEPVFC